MAFEQISTSKGEAWSITKRYSADPKRNVVLIQVSFDKKDPDLELTVYYDPSIANSGMNDTASTHGRHMVATEARISSALTCKRCVFSEQTNGFYGVNDDSDPILRDRYASA